MIDNDKLAAAIVALYTVVSRDGNWGESDELVQQQAFGLWNAMTWSAEAMALYLMRNGGWNEDDTAEFVDISLSRVRAVWREYEAERNARNGGW